MKKRMFHKGMAAVLAVSLTTGGALPFMAQTVHAEDTAAEQGQIPEKKSGVVTLEKTDGSYVFGNEYLKRTFSLSADKVLSTKEITNYRTGTTPTVFTPQAGSEEFIINTLDNNSEGEDSGFVAPKKKLDTNGWTAEADSVATNEGANGGADKMFDGKNDTYYHSKYNEGTDAERKYPHNIYVDFGAEKSFQSLRYQQRVDAQGNPTVSGHVKSYKIYTGDSIDALKQATDAQPVAEGSFDNKKETYVNLKEKVTAKCVRIEFVDCHDPSDSNVSKDVACCSEFDFFEDTATFPEATDDATQLKTSEMKVQGEPELTEKDGVKTLTFTFEPKRVRGVDYTIKEVITMKDGDSFMRKRLDISVGEGQAEKAKIDYIDLESGYPGCSSAMRTDSPSFTTRTWTPLSIGRTRRHTAGNYGGCVCGPWVRRICGCGNICRSRFKYTLGISDYPAGWPLFSYTEPRGGKQHEGILECDPDGVHRCGRVAWLLPWRQRRAAYRPCGVCSSGLHHGRNVCRIGQEAQQPGGIQGYLPQGADLPAGGDRPHPGRAGHWNRLCTAHGSDLLLSVQRGREHY